MGISGREIVERMTAIKPLKCYVQDLGIPNQTISNWKNRNAPPRANELLKIAMYLDVSIEWLLTGQERTAPELPQDVLNLAFEIRTKSRILLPADLIINAFSICLISEIIYVFISVYNDL